jgi:hypothetical protein
MRTLRSLLVGLALLSFAGGAQALIVDLPDSCSTCQGLTGSLEIVDGGGSFSVKLTLNSDGYTGDRLGLNQVGFGGLGGWSSVSLVSSPTAGWANPVGSPISSNGPCANVGAGGGKVCTHGFVNITGGGDFVWEFAVVGGTLKETPWHIGAQFANQAGGARGQILSEEGSPSTSPIPEPTAALIFGACVFAVSRSGRRR